MYKSKLVELFKTLEKRDIRALKRWLQSPIHNEHQDVQKMFDFLLSRYNISEKTLQKTRVWTYIYPDQEYNDLRLRHLMSFSLKVLESFVSYKIAIQDDFYQQKNLAKHYLETQIQQMAIQALEKAELELQKSLLQGENFYLKQYELEVIKFDLKRTRDRNQATNITQITTNASLFFMITTLRYAYIALSHQNLLKTNYDIPLLDAVLLELQQAHYQQYPMLMIYYHGYYTLKKPGEEQHFKQLKYYLETYQTHLELKEQRAVLLMALNYAIKRMNTGSDIYTQEAFILYKRGLEHNLLLENGVLSRFAYKNIISLGIAHKEFHWVEKFIEDYTIQLEADFQEHYKHYNQARLFFEKGELNKAMELLVQVEYEDILLNIGAKVMLLKLYYQKQYWAALESLLESFRVFLNRKKGLSYHKPHYINLIVCTKKILNTPSFDKVAIEKLKESISATTPLAEKGWLLEQVYKL